MATKVMIMMIIMIMCIVTEMIVVIDMKLFPLVRDI